VVAAIVFLLALMVEKELSVTFKVGIESRLNGPGFYRIPKGAKKL
jgi:hypothetical protein